MLQVVRGWFGGACFFVVVFFLGWGLMAGFKGCANHWVLFNQGAGSQKWKPLDIPGTKPPLSDVVVDLLDCINIGASKFCSRVSCFCH